MRRGDVFNLGLPKGVGHEQHGKRYGVIEIEGTETKVLVEQMGAVDVNCLGDIAGHLSSAEQWGVDAAILTVLGLN